MELGDFGAAIAFFGDASRAGADLHLLLEKHDSVQKAIDFFEEALKCNNCSDMACTTNYGKFVWEVCVGSELRGQ